MSDYGDYRKSISPAWLQARFGAAWADALGQLQDFVADKAKAAVKARFPLLAPADALEQIGIERGLPRGPNEADSAYATRLRAAWDIWQNAGTAFGMLTALSAVGYTAELRIQNALRYYLKAAGSLAWEKRAAGEWRVDGNTAFWSRFVVLLLPPFPSIAYGAVVHDSGTSGVPTPSGSAPTFLGTVKLKITGAGSADGGAQFAYSTDGGTTWSAGQNVTTSPSELGTTGIFVAFPAGTYTSDTYHFSVGPPADGSADSMRVRSLVSRWKPAHATCADILAIPSGRTWGSYPTGATWGAQQRATWGSDVASPVHWSP